MIRASAPGKLMLMGEHAVVYGHPCLVTAIDTRLTVSVEKIEGTDVVIEAPQATNTTFLSGVVELVKTKWGTPLSGVKITTQSAFSSQYGLGSSSAVVVAAIFALRDFLERKDSPEELFLLARQAIIDVQGAGSGFDVAAAMFGGTLYYEKTTPTIEPLDAAAMRLVVGYTGVKADTTALVTDIAKKRAREQAKVDKIFQAIEQLVLEAKQRTGEGDWQRVGKLFDFNQEYLRDLGVSSEKLESLIVAAKGAGAWGAKLSGAGGGDCMIALADPALVSGIEQAIEKAGGEIVRVLPNAEGVKIEL